LAVQNKACAAMARDFHNKYHKYCKYPDYHIKEKLANERNKLSISNPVHVDAKEVARGDRGNLKKFAESWGKDSIKLTLEFLSPKEKKKNSEGEGEGGIVNPTVILEREDGKRKRTIDRIYHDDGDDDRDGENEEDSDLALMPRRNKQRKVKENDREYQEMMELVGDDSMNSHDSTHSIPDSLTSSEGNRTDPALSNSNSNYAMALDKNSGNVNSTDGKHDTESVIYEACFPWMQKIYNT
jgi:hypothetical protein